MQPVPAAVIASCLPLVLRDLFSIITYINTVSTRTCDGPCDKDPFSRTHTAHSLPPTALSDPAEAGRSRHSHVRSYAREAINSITRTLT